MQGDIVAVYDGNGTKYGEYAYDAWGKCSIIYDKDGIATKNPYRYRGYYLDKETDLYYLKSRYYDPEAGRFISSDAISELDAEEINGLNLYRYCANNPVMMNDTEGNAPAWWEWVVSGILIVVGTVLCATFAGSAFGAGLIAAGGSMMASNIMSAIGVDGKVASIISAGLNIVAGVALCFTPLAALGASMIGSGVGSIGGGFLSEALGFGFQAGAMIGGIVGGIIGGQIYKGIAAKDVSLSSSKSGNSPKIDSSVEGQGFDTFDDFKKAMGSAGPNKEWHHIVEQSQIRKSGFSPRQIHNTKNIIAIDKTIHRQVSGYYNRILDFTNNTSVRNWLAGQSYQKQYEFGLQVLRSFGVQC